MMKKILSKEKNEKSPKFNIDLKSNKFPIYLCLSVFICGLISFFLIQSNKISAEETNIKNEIENAMFEKQEFFGVETLVPFPTKKVQENLINLQKRFPENILIIEKSAEVEEKLENYEMAENHHIFLAEKDSKNFKNLAYFYNQRGRYSDEAKTWEKLFFIEQEDEKKIEIFSKLLETARIHGLKEYLASAYLNKIITENKNFFPVFEQIYEQFIKDENFAEALEFIKQAKQIFPEQKEILLEKEISTLLAMKNSKEAEKVYLQAFDPFWSDDETRKFYNFLSDQDRLRAYGSELERDFKNDSANFQTAIRLIHYRKYNYDDFTEIIQTLKKHKQNWTAEELVTTARFLLAANEGDLASRFLYTLFLREDFKTDKNLRAIILYQLFEIFSDAEKQKLSLVKGDLNFYKNIAKADTNPGISTGILSLIFSDSEIAEKFAKSGKGANKLFNLAAAYYLFSNYKKEFPTSPELAQMYLDIIRLHTANGETEIAAENLKEFEQRYEKTDEYALVSLKLADAFAAAKQPNKQIEIYQEVLDYLGKKENVNLSAKSVDDFENKGINVPDNGEKDDVYYDYSENNFHDYLGKNNTKISYRDVLGKLVNLLAKEKKTAEILAVYSNEIAKYKDAEWLYEARLEWLEQTNLIAEHTKTYRQAFEHFPTNKWRDKLARWFLRFEGKTEFAEFSTQMISTLNDEETENYLREYMTDPSVDEKGFRNELYLKLYTSAHERFPHKTFYVWGLMNFYKENKQMEVWRKLAAENFFISTAVREEFLNDLAKSGELRTFLSKAKSNSNVYKMFRAEANLRLSQFEKALPTYGEFAEIYPNEPEYANRLVNLSRSFGQKDKTYLKEAARISNKQADFYASWSVYPTETGEIYAEMNDYEKAGENWEKLIKTAEGTRENYLETATIYWDYFQFNKARNTLQKLREKEQNANIYAFEMGAIYEGENDFAGAIGEYVKALDADRNEAQESKAKKRLVQLFTKNKQFENQINTAFAKEVSRREDASFLVLAYAEVLNNAGQKETSENLLTKRINSSNSYEFLTSALDFFESEENQNGVQIALRRLAETLKSPRKQIEYSLKSAQNYRTNQKPAEAKNVLQNLLRKFPTNYGVLNESAEVLQKIGFSNDAEKVLQSGINRGDKTFKTIFAQKLAALYIEQNKLDSAENILLKLHQENPADTEIFRVLANVYVREKNVENLQKLFGETLNALKQSDLERREINRTIADLRGGMIEAYTNLEDYQAAIDQHIEIINRNTDSETAIENAISYAKRYGGAERLLKYYENLSKEAFKNYRWNVILAKIYLADGNVEKALENYRTAIINQPEIADLYLQVAEIEAGRSNFDAALENVDKILKLSNNAPEFIKVKIKFLRQADRFSEAENLKAKLPVAEKPKDLTLFEQAESAENSAELYKKAFEELNEKPLEIYFNSANILGYVQKLRKFQTLDESNKKLWELRGKLINIADKENSVNAGEARRKLSVLNTAIVESIGKLGGESATDAELAELHKFFEQKIDASGSNEVSDGEILLVQNIAVRIGFGDLDEKILLKKLNDSISENKEINLQNLINFYEKNGAFQKSFEVLQKFKTNNLPLLANAARLAGNNENELETLRKIYWQQGEKPVSTKDENIERFLDILYKSNCNELISLTEKSSAYQLQLINFLMEKGERELTHKAIENSRFSAAWKLARNAEASLALKEFADADADCYFCDALQFDSIGGLVSQTPDKRSFLINDDWFRLSLEYGEWLFESKDKEIQPAKFLTAMTENRPRDAGEQFKLGQFYLSQNDAKKAVEHFRLALELNPQDISISAHLGTALYISGEPAEAENIWSELLENNEIENLQIYFQALNYYGLSEIARNRISPLLIENLKENDSDLSKLSELIRQISLSFESENSKLNYFLKIIQNAPTDKKLAEILIDENLISDENVAPCYKILIDRSDELNSYDYQYREIFERKLETDLAEAFYFQTVENKSDVPENERFKRQEQFLNLLVEQEKDANAFELIEQIEQEIRGKYVRPDWLRLAKMRLQIRENRFDLKDAETFVGIRVDSSVQNIKPPDIERLNEILQILRDEKQSAKEIEIQTAFHAQMTALQKFGTANFAGLIRSFYQSGDTEKAQNLVWIFVELSMENKRDAALAKLNSLPIIKEFSADAAKYGNSETLNFPIQTETLKTSAEIATEFDQTELAVQLRRKLLRLDSSDEENKFSLGQIYLETGETETAKEILKNLIADKNSNRNLRWKAKVLLKDLGENIEIADVKFDFYSQFYNGLFKQKIGQNDSAIGYFINSLIAKEDAETTAKIELLKLYAMQNQNYAVLKLSESITEKSDELLIILSESAEKISDFQKALEFENQKSVKDSEQIKFLQNLLAEKNKKATDFKVDLENTRKL